MISGWSGDDEVLPTPSTARDRRRRRSPPGRKNDSTGRPTKRHRCHRAHPRRRQSVDGQQKVMGKERLCRCQCNDGLLVGASRRALIDAARVNELSAPLAASLPGTMNSVINAEAKVRPGVALLAVRRDRSDRRVSRQPRNHLVPERSAQLESESQSQDSKRSDEICRCGWPPAPVTVVVASDYPPPWDVSSVT
jgi:hypothetical protein